MSTELKEGAQSSNFAETEIEEHLLMVCNVNDKFHQNFWYLDTGCSNHMSGGKKMFFELDESFCNTVKFGDNSIISVTGKERVALGTKDNSTCTISNVVYALILKTNLLSMGQLQ